MEASSFEIAAGRSSVTINVTVFGDTVDEADESVMMELFNPPNAVFANAVETLRSKSVILVDGGSGNDWVLFVNTL